jgi:hypothetical protein
MADSPRNLPHKREEALFPQPPPSMAGVGLLNGGTKNFELVVYPYISFDYYIKNKSIVYF